MRPGGAAYTFFRCPHCNLRHRDGTAMCVAKERPIAEDEQRTWLEQEPAARQIAYDVTVDSQRTAGDARGRAIVQPGYVLESRYVIGRPLGRGAMGAVYEARHVLLNRRVAVKVMEAADAAKESALRERVLQEGRNLASVVHPHVVEVYDVGFTEGLCYLVMAYLEGETLEDLLARRGFLDVPLACSLARQILSGLAAAHARGVVHRDMKPANVFLASAGDDALHAKILDFGISTTLASAAASPVAGTPSYMAPEQMSGAGVDERTDLYALGVTLYEVLTGQRPFAAPSMNALYYKICFRQPLAPSRVRPEISPRLEALLLRALSKKREERFSSAIEMMDALDAALRTGGSVQAARGKREYVLVAEPAPEIAARCRAVSEELGRSAVLARDGAEALEMAQSLGPPALVTANLSLPRIDGFALLLRLREKLGASVPAVVASPFQALREAADARREALGIVSVLNDLGRAEPLREAMAIVFNGIQTPASAGPEGITESGEERRRLARIDAMGLVDDRSPPDALQHLVGEVAEALGVPIALVSLVLEDRQWFKAYFGLEGDLLADRGTPRDWALCTHVVQGREPLVVPDAPNHPVFSENPLVRRGTVGGYIGAPVVSPAGDVLGTLCVIDNKPLRCGPDAVEALCALARRVGGELSLSVRASPTPPPPPASPSAPPFLLLPSLADDPGGTAPPASGLDLGALMRDPSLGVVVLDEDRNVSDVSTGFSALMSVPRDSVLGLGRDRLLQTIAGRFEDPPLFLRRTAVLPRGPFSAFDRFAPSGEPARRIAWHAKPLATPRGVWHLETYRLER